MRIFFSSTFMKQEELNKEGIFHHIKLEYYKIINEDEIIKQKKAKFGIDVVKTEYIKDDIKVENKQVKYISSDEEKINKILKTFKECQVTPIIVEDVLSDLSKEYFCYD